MIPKFHSAEILYNFKRFFILRKILNKCKSLSKKRQSIYDGCYGFHARAPKKMKEENKLSKEGMKMVPGETNSKIFSTLEGQKTCSSCVRIQSLRSLPVMF
jgi:hypothetical protein